MEEEAAAREGIVTADGVWPPPPTGGVPARATVLLPTFAPVRPLARPLLVLLTAYAATAALSLACTPFPAAIRWFHPGAIGLLQSVLLLGIAAYFLTWTYRLSRNLRALGATGLRTAPAWAVFFFFVPLLNLYRPYQTFREIWQASVPTQAAGAWRKVRPPALLGFWWASVLLMDVLDALANKDYGGAGVAVADDAADLLCALLTAQLVRMMTTRQEKSARALLGI